MITQNDIVTYCINDSNFDTTLITDEMINISLVRHIEPLLGEILFHKIINDTATYSGIINGETYTYDGYTYTFLGIKKMASWFALYDALPFIHNQIRNLGVRISQDETSEAGDLKEMRKQAFEMGQSYRDSMNNYILRKQNSTTIYKDFIQKTNKIIGGIYL